MVAVVLLEFDEERLKFVYGHVALLLINSKLGKPFNFGPPLDFLC